MGFNEVGQTGLGLGLGLSSPSSAFETKPKSPPAARNLHRTNKINDPLLRLTLSGSEILDQHRPLDSSMTASSSFISKVRVKREEQSLAVDGDEDVSNGRKKLRLTKAQSSILEERFKNHSTLNPKQKQELARMLHLRPRQVEVWFQNRRARTKLKQTEIDCEFLKKCCESLTDENMRLQKELHELKLAKPVYLQLSAATLAVCPSCEKSAASVPGTSAKLGHFNMARKPIFYRRYTNHPSAAC